jgi:hypothetical protein
MMRHRRGNTNIRILQTRLEDLTTEDKPKVDEIKPKSDTTPFKGKGLEVPLIVDLPKKKGIKKDELINTKRLLTM